MDPAVLIREWAAAKRENADAAVGPILRNPGGPVTEEEMARRNRAHFALLRAEERLLMFADREEAS